MPLPQLNRLDPLVLRVITYHIVICLLLMLLFQMQKLLRRLVMRHSINQELHGNPLLTLPPRYSLCLSVLFYFGVHLVYFDSFGLFIFSSWFLYFIRHERIIKVDLSAEERDIYTYNLRISAQSFATLASKELLEKKYAYSMITSPSLI